MKVPFVVCILPRTTTTHNQGLLLLHWTTNVLVYLTFNSRTEIVISQNSQSDLQSTICQIDRHATHLHGHWILVGVTLIWINTRPQPFIRNLRPNISSSSALTRPPTFSAAGWLMKESHRRGLNAIRTDLHAIYYIGGPLHVVSLSRHPHLATHTLSQMVLEWLRKEAGAAVPSPSRSFLLMKMFPMINLTFAASVTFNSLIQRPLFYYHVLPSASA